jgi:hypothetical protein|tara:strand:- start:174 stop:572 length:399 start_codon:yes stop_codon:yes gene_type:complete
MVNMKWLDKLTGKKEEVAEEVAIEKTSEEVRREALAFEKEEATLKGEAWIGVLDTQVNPADIKNGFFELDWNNEFIEQLMDAGYIGESQEQIVDVWFRTVANAVLEEDGVDKDVKTGYINTSKLNDKQSEVK